MIGRDLVAITLPEGGLHEPKHVALTILMAKLPAQKDCVDDVAAIIL